MERGVHELTNPAIESRQLGKTLAKRCRGQFKSRANYRVRRGALYSQRKEERGKGMKEKGGGGRSEEDRSVVSVIADFDRARHPGRKEEGRREEEISASRGAVFP